MNLHRTIAKRDVEEVRKALAAGADPNARDATGRTPLLAAIEGDQLEVFQLLLEAGADVHAGEAGERFAGDGVLTPLGLASAYGRRDMAERLLARGAKADFGPDERIGALRVRPPLAAVVHQQYRVASPLIALLISAGADPNRFLDVGTTILDRALVWNDRRVVEALRKAGARTAAELRAAGAPGVPTYERLADAARYGDLAAIQRLAGAGADPNAPDASGASPLRLAASGGHAAAFEALLAAGARLDQGASGGWTLLTYAADGGSLEIVRRLLAAGFKVDGKAPPTPPGGAGRSAKASAKHPNWHTPLMAACRHGRLEMARLLLESGADPEAKHGTLTPLKWAKQARHKEVVALLESAGSINFDRDPSKEAVRNFPGSAETESFVAVLALLQELTGRKPQTWSKRKGVFVVEIGEKSWARAAARYGLPAPPEAPEEARSAAIQDLESRLQDEVFKLGGQFLQHDAPRFLLFPTTDPYAPLVACGTNGINAGRDTEAVVEWLRNMARRNPFRLTGCGFDWLAGRFLGEVQGALALAEEMIAFCPDVEGPAAELAAELESTRRLYFWWD